MDTKTDPRIISSWLLSSPNPGAVGKSHANIYGDKYFVMLRAFFTPALSNIYGDKYFVMLRAFFTPALKAFN
jgi:hypothetical protein